MKGKVFPTITAVLLSLPIIAIFTVLAIFPLQQVIADDVGGGYNQNGFWNTESDEDDSSGGEPSGVGKDSGKNLMGGLDAMRNDPNTAGLLKDEPSEVIGRVLNYALALIGSVLVAMIVYGGFLYLTSAGSEEKIKSAKSVLTYAIIGVTIVIGAFVIVNFVISALV